MHYNMKIYNFLNIKNSYITINMHIFVNYIFFNIPKFRTSGTSISSSRILDG